MTVLVTYVAVRGDLDLPAGAILAAGLRAIGELDDEAHNEVQHSIVVLVRPATKAILDEAIADAVCLGWDVGAASAKQGQFGLDKNETLAVAFQPAAPGAYPALDDMERA